MRWRAKSLICFWLSYVGSTSSAWKNPKAGKLPPSHFSLFNCCLTIVTWQRAHLENLPVVFCHNKQCSFQPFFFFFFFLILFFGSCTIQTSCAWWADICSPRTLRRRFSRSSLAAASSCRRLRILPIYSSLDDTLIRLRVSPLSSSLFRMYEMSMSSLVKRRQRINRNKCEQPC